MYRVYTTTLRSLIPLPRVDVPASDPSHLNHYPEYRAGSTVLALFPDTTSFYKAEVISTPKDMQTAGQRVSHSPQTPIGGYGIDCYVDRAVCYQSRTLLQSSL